MSEVPDTAPHVIVAKASRDYRWRRYLLVIVIMGYGIWSIYDGFYKMPRENQEFHEKFPDLEKLPHPALDIPFNQWMGRILPPVSVIFLVWVLYASRGKYEFDGENLITPGNGSVPVKAIRRIDRAKWDRKGIAYLHYQVAGSAKLGVIRLDDFIYERKPTDEIYRRISIVIDGMKVTPANVAQQRIICKACGVQNLPTATVCSGCGAPLDLDNLISR